MSLYRFSNNPTAEAVTTLQASINSSVTSLTLAADVAGLPSAGSFDILIGSELLHVGARSGVTLSSLTRGYGGSTAASHTAGDSIFNPLTVEGFLANPGPMTTSGDLPYLNSSLRPARLAAPADGTYAVAWASGVPSWVVAGGSPAGPSGALQFYNAGVLGGSANLTWDGDSVYIGGDLPAYVDTEWMGFADLFLGPVNDYAAVIQSAPSGQLYGLQQYMFEGTAATPTATTDTAGMSTVASFGFDGTVPRALTDISSYQSGSTWATHVAGSLVLTAERWAAGVPYGDSAHLYIGYWLSATAMARMWSPELTGAATNAYYQWFDSDGVFRIREDATFNSVGQAIAALYNPQVTKYTPGLANYERIVFGQWSSNVAQYGTEAGGTGVLRGVQVIGASLITPASLTVGSNLVTLGGAFTTSGANTLTLTTTAATNVTLPTSGTLVATVGPTFTAPVVITGVVGSSALTLTGATQTASFPVLSATQTWNNAGVAFKGLVFNATDTASAAASVLLDLQVGSSSALSIMKSGRLVFGNTGSLAVPNITFQNSALVYEAGGNLLFRAGTANFMIFPASSSVDGLLAFGVSFDTFLQRDAAGVLAQVNSTNAQTMRVYGAFTNASNYARGALIAGATSFTIAAQTAGTGADDQDLILTPAGVGNVVFPGGVLLRTVAVLTDGAAAQLGTLTNAPIAGNPTKWIPINDNGTTRYVPAW